jgi:transposase-like protein
MNLIELSKYLQDEKAAENYLYEKGILKKFTECPYCKSDKIGNIRRGRVKYYKCKKEWHKRSGSILESKHIECGSFVALLKLFSDGIGVTEATFQLELNVKTVIMIYDELAEAILNEYSIDSKIFSNEEFYIAQIEDSEIQVLKNLPTAKSKNVTYGKFRMLRTRNLDQSYSFSYEFDWVQAKDRANKNNINRFLNYLKHNLAIYRGISQKHFQQYFGILLIRYNAQEKDLFNILLKSLKIKGWSKLPDARKCIDTLS